MPTASAKTGRGPILYRTRQSNKWTGQPATSVVASGAMLKARKVLTSVSAMAEMGYEEPFKMRRNGEEGSRVASLLQNS